MRSWSCKAETEEFLQKKNQVQAGKNFDFFENQSMQLKHTEGGGKGQKPE